MRIDTSLFIDMLNIDSTTGRERALADYLRPVLEGMGAHVTLSEGKGPDEPVNVLARWSARPHVTFCTHLDTVPPYIAPTTVVDTDGQVVEVRGRGACDAKGQIIAMLTACQELVKRGERDVALLLLHGEETGSYGAKEHRQQPGGQYVVVGEPTDNRLVVASKGTKAFEVTIRGRAAHSGYPEQGVSAVERFVDLANTLRSWRWPADNVLGDTTYNIGRLVSDNPQNILSPRLTCRIYFRTTFASDRLVEEKMCALASSDIEVTALGGDSPTRYYELPGLPTTTVAFGSDAPQLTNYEHKMLIGPGSILVAHTPDEHVLVSELNQAADNYINIYYALLRNPIITT